MSAKSQAEHANQMSRNGALRTTARNVVKYGRHRGVQRTRLDATSWVDAGIEILVRGSIEHVRVERLARQLGVTKGSFYWHFKSRADLESAILDRWYQRATVGVRERADREGSTPAEKLLRLLELPFWSPTAGRAADLELAIRAWSRRSQLARRAVNRVDSLRIEYLCELFGSIGSSEPEAIARAHLTYAFMRYLSQLRDVDEDAMHGIIEAGHRLLISD